METITVSKHLFSKILADVEILVDDVELALNNKIQQRVADIESRKVKGKTENEYYNYLTKRGIKFGKLHSKVSS